jgi:hypothetical protein
MFLDVEHAAVGFDVLVVEEVGFVDGVPLLVVLVGAAPSAESEEVEAFLLT